MPIVAVSGQKGGIGKSTITGNLAAELTELGRSVIVLDADPQHSLAAWAALGTGVLAQCVEKVKDGKPEVLRAGARAAAKAVDVVLIDTPPGMSPTTYQAALLADLVLLPCGPSPLDLFSLRGAMKMALQARAQRRCKRPRIRLVPSRVLMTTNLGRGLVSSLEQTGRKVLPAIGQRVVVAEAAGSGLTVAEYAPGSVAQLEFEKLAHAVDKILRR